MKILVKSLLRVLLVATVVAYGAINVAAAPDVKLTSSTSQARKGEPFKVYLTIGAQEKLEGVHVVYNLPTGFSVSAGTNVPATLEAGSSFTGVYDIKPPSEFQSGGDTREAKRLVFNLMYNTAGDGQTTTRCQSTDLTVKFSLAPWLYILLGVLGLALGSLIKTLTKYQADKLAAKKAALFSEEYWQRATGPLFTNVAVGFVVLLVLSTDQLPTKGWYDTIALGVAVAILSDEQLLSKVRAIV